MTVTLRDPDGYTVPPPLTQQTIPPAPDARQIELSTNWGTISPDTVAVDDQGIATTILFPEATPAPATIVLTAMDFCGYSVTSTVSLPDPVITKTTAMLQVARGGLLTYTITYCNIGADSAENVEIMDVLPSGTTYVSDDSGLPCPACYAGSTGPLIWTVGSLAPLAGDSSTLVLREDNSNPCSAMLTNTVSITATTLDRDTMNNEDQAGPVHVIGAELTIAKTTSSPEVLPGNPLDYTISYRNDGDARADDVEITDILPPGTTYDSDNSGLPCPACVPGSTGPLVWTVGSLDSGAGSSFDLVLRVDSSVPPSTTLTNTVSIATTTSECGDLPNEDQASAHVRTNLKLYVANRHSGTVDVFDAADFSYITTIPVGVNPCWATTSL